LPFITTCCGIEVVECMLRTAANVQAQARLIVHGVSDGVFGGYGGMVTLPPGRLPVTAREAAVLDGLVAQ
jgi:hypothetical protein